MHSVSWLRFADVFQLFCSAFFHTCSDSLIQPSESSRLFHHPLCCYLPLRMAFMYRALRLCVYM